MIADRIADAIPEEGTTLPDLMRTLRRRPGTRRIPRSRVEDALARDPRFVPAGEPPKVRWRVDPDVNVDHRSAGPASAPVRSDRPLDGMELRDWQIAAFAAWTANRCRGVVEAVTGTGKTRLALAAARAMLSRGGRVLVLVPTLDLMDQWAGRLRQHAPEARVGRLGGGGDDDLHDHHVLIATPHSAAALPIDLPPGSPGLLIADEAHRYGAPTWADALKDDFEARLALTATYERSDDGLVEVLGPYFGPVVHGYGFAEARRDGVIAPFRVAFLAVHLGPAERDAYRAADRQLRHARRELVDQGLPQEPRELIATAASIVGAADGRPAGSGDRELAAARAFLAGIRSRRDVAATCAAKLDVCTAAAPALVGRRSLIFTDTTDQAERAARTLAGRGLAAETVHGGLDERRRRIRLAQFGNGNLDALAAPRVLDEGIDVPDADVAVVLAAFRTRRQMIQRLGRVLRLKPDGGRAHLVIAHAAGTREDPGDGAHDDFLAEVVDVAEDIVHLDLDDGPRGVRRWLSGGPRTEATVPAEART